MTDVTNAELRVQIGNRSFDRANAQAPDMANTPAPKERKNAAHGASRGRRPKRAKKPRRGRKKIASRFPRGLGSSMFSTGHNLSLTDVSFAPSGLGRRAFAFPHGLRRGLHSSAASRLAAGANQRRFAWSQNSKHPHLSNSPLRFLALLWYKQFTESICVAGWALFCNSRARPASKVLEG